MKAKLKVWQLRSRMQRDLALQVGTLALHPFPKHASQSMQICLLECTTMTSVLSTLCQNHHSLGMRCWVPSQVGVGSGQVRLKDGGERLRASMAATAAELASALHASEAAGNLEDPWSARAFVNASLSFIDSEGRIQVSSPSLIYPEHQPTFIYTSAAKGSWLKNAQCETQACKYINQEACPLVSLFLLKVTGQEINHSHNCECTKFCQSCEVACRVHSRWPI